MSKVHTAMMLAKIHFVLCCITHFITRLNTTMLYRVALQVYSLATVVTASVMYIHLTTTAAAPVVAAAAAATAAAAVLITKLLQRACYSNIRSVRHTK
jgi:hypothetical protein